MYRAPGLLFFFFFSNTGCCCLVTSCLTLASPWTAACQAPLFMGFPRQEYWSGLPFPSPGDLTHPGIEPMSPAGESLPLSHLGSPFSSQHLLSITMRHEMSKRKEACRELPIQSIFNLFIRWLWHIFLPLSF